MFESGVYAADMIADIKNEVDVALPIPNKAYVGWLNSLEQLLYTEIIKEQHEARMQPDEDGCVDPADIAIVEYEQAAVRYDDIYTVFCGDTQLIRSTPASGTLFPDTYWRQDDKLYINSDGGDTVRVIYFIRPMLKRVDTNDGVQSAQVMLPPEFLPLMGARLRGEAYRLMNENTLAANWLSEYNTILESFKVWMAARQPRFGM